MASPLQLELIDAIEHNNIDGVRRVIQQDSSVVRSPYGMFNFSFLHSASALGCKQIVEELLANKADVNAKDIMGCTPLHFACKNNHPDVVKLLLAKGAMLDARGPDGSLPIHVAAVGSTPEVLKELLSHTQADIGAVNYKQNTALHYAALFGSGNNLVEVVRELLKHKADINAANDEGNTPIHLIVTNKHINPNLKVAILKIFQNNNGQFGIQNNQGKTAVELADQQIVKDFLSKT